MAARGQRAVALLVALATAAGAGVLSACSHAEADHLDYAVDGALVSYNTTTVAGAASAGAQAFARTLTGFGYHGPDGQVVADRDFGSISVVSRAPITCDDLVLAWAAQSGRFPGFDAASRAGYADIADIDCKSGQKKARVQFAQGRSLVYYQELFGATAIMPSHVIGDKLGVNTTEALLADDAPVVEKIAQAWNTTWQLNHGIDLAEFPSSGPYRIESVLDSGAVVLVANDRWWGTKPATQQVTVWPQGTDIADRINKRTVEVVDVATGSAGSLITPDDYQNT